MNIVGLICLFAGLYLLVSSLLKISSSYSEENYSGQSNNDFIENLRKISSKQHLIQVTKKLLGHKQSQSKFSPGYVITKKKRY